jgi:hypothetical protein
MALPEHAFIIQPDASLVRLKRHESREEELLSLSDVRALTERLGCAALHETSVFASIEYHHSEWLHRGALLLRLGILPDGNATATFTDDGTSVRTRSIRDLRSVLVIAWERLLREIGPSARELAAQSLTGLLRASPSRRRRKKKVDVPF